MNLARRIAKRVLTYLVCGFVLYFGAGFLVYHVYGAMGKSFGYSLARFHPMMTSMGVKDVCMMSERLFLITDSPWRAYAVRLLHRECHQQLGPDADTWLISHYAMCHGLLWRFTGDRGELEMMLKMISKYPQPDRESGFFAACRNSGLGYKVEWLLEIVNEGDSQHIKDATTKIVWQ